MRLAAHGAATGIMDICVSTCSIILVCVALDARANFARFLMSLQLETLKPLYFFVFPVFGRSSELRKRPSSVLVGKTPQNIGNTRKNTQDAPTYMCRSLYVVVSCCRPLRFGVPFSATKAPTEHEAELPRASRVQAATPCRTQSSKWLKLRPTRSNKSTQINKAAHGGRAIAWNT